MSEKLQNLDTTTSVGAGDILYTVVDPAGTPLDKKITVANLKTSLGLTGTNSGDQDLSGYLQSSTAATTYEPIKGTDDNYVTDAEKVVIGNTSGTNTGDQTSVSGNAGTATALATARTIGTVTGDATSTGSSFDGTSNNTNALTLATVNSDVGSFTNANITVNAKGLVTAASNGSGGASAPAMQWTTDFPITTRFNKQQSGGSNTFNSDGLSVSSGGSASGWAITRFDLGAGWGSGTAILGGTQVMSTRFYVGAGSDFCMAFGIGEMINDMAAGTNTMTSKHIGFKITRTGSGTINLYATQADGTTETVSSSLTTLSGGEEMELILQINGSASVDYYWRKNGGALSSATNLTTNIPSTGERWLCWGVNNNAVASAATMYAFNGAYSR